MATEPLSGTAHAIRAPVEPGAAGRGVPYPRRGGITRSLWGALLAVSASAAGPPPPTYPKEVRKFTPAQSTLLLQQPARMDEASAKLMQRVADRYGRLDTFQSETRARDVASQVLVKRPRYYHFLQTKPNGELISLAISDGTHYYEYSERTRHYLERPAAILDHLTLPTNVRLFFHAQKSGAPMLGLDGEPVVFDYAFRYAGQKRIAGKTADGVRVSTIVRGADGGWLSFDSTRYYDASGLLVRTVRGDLVTEVVNKPGVKLPASGFRWKPIPGASKGFG